ncbi:MAG: hypothetical protein IPJ38_06505 [Dechloromonas sp.]|uniref:Uncharacterized protein n=1 Tax=Candidatus Dechloromonas phosphorivorans TaxID=2899244 RepID=A0A935K9P9_9RHOO|nr:hypothetical protein [Candidatus Dechloromonas phosphorivorans]
MPLRLKLRIAPVRRFMSALQRTCTRREVEAENEARQAFEEVWKANPGLDEKQVEL